MVGREEDLGRCERGPLQDGLLLFEQMVQMMVLSGFPNCVGFEEISRYALHMLKLCNGWQWAK